jgi:hypothetical protein
MSKELIYGIAGFLLGFTTGATAMTLVQVLAHTFNN